MLPRWHILWGAVFTLLLWVSAPSLHGMYLLLVFFSSVFIDVDHYICAVLKTKKLGLLHAFEYHRKLEMKHQKELKRGKRVRGDFHFFHTIEFHILIALLSLVYAPLLYIFIGMTFHSLLDVGSMLSKDILYRREFFFFAWLQRKF